MKTLLSTLLTTFFFSVILSLPLTSIAQGENNIWAFGDSLGLDFNSGSPVPIATSIQSRESAGTACNAAGQLLFYIGVTELTYMPNSILDRTNQIMPNGGNILGNFGSSAVNGICIVPFINDTNLYYVFVLSADEERQRGLQTYLRYSVVDMRLNGGLGDVDVARKNIIIDSFTSEQMRITKGLNCELWLIATHNDTLIFDAFKITADGIDNKPVTTGLPSAKSLNLTICDFDISPDGSQVVYHQIGPSPKLILYDFNKTDGTITNPQILDTGMSGVCRVKFSPNGSKLYLTTDIEVLQYDYSQYPSIPDIVASKTSIWNKSVGAFRTGPDKKMYALTPTIPSITQKVICINKPEAAGSSCDITQIIDLNKSQQSNNFGLPIITLAAATSTSSRTDTTICQASQATLSATIGYNSYTWSNGSVGETLQVSQDGTYWVQMQRECSSHTDTFVVRFVNIPTILKPTDSICNNSEILLDATTALASYLWQDASTAATYTASKEGNYTVVIKVGPCQSTQTTTISNKSFSIDLGEDKKLCDGESVLLKVDAAFDAMAWNDGSTADTLVVNNSGQYAVMVQKGICIAKDSVQIDFVGCSNCIAFPNAFTPNNDNKNDYYRPILNCNVLSYSFKVYNRYGQEVFASKNPADKWDGSFKGQPLGLGVYYYFVKVQYDYPNAQEELYKGDIALVR
ncbi:MAG: gliding motility-associated C-terminal domain-containing protein [Chitinophagaceae bacterium]|nr:gliding motility-associated C-terminal domain-containing protein [Chitinophagaceae bacterium]